MKAFVQDWVQDWEESERGWGVRPDGFSLHLSMADRDRYVKNYWDRMPKETPDEYSRPSMKKLYEIEIPDHVANKLFTSDEDGLRFFTKPDWFTPA